MVIGEGRHRMSEGREKQQTRAVSESCIKYAAWWNMCATFKNFCISLSFQQVTSVSEQTKILKWSLLFNFDKNFDYHRFDWHRRDQGREGEGTEITTGIKKRCPECENKWLYCEGGKNSCLTCYGKNGCSKEIYTFMVNRKDLQCCHCCGVKESIT